MLAAAKREADREEALQTVGHALAVEVIDTLVQSGLLEYTDE